MFAEDVRYLCCPISLEPLEIISIQEQDTDAEIISGELCSIHSKYKYTISNGIPRFIFDHEYNKSWDYKWTHIDKGQGINYKVANPSDLAYKIHDIFDRNNHDGEAYLYAKGKTVLDLGCGIGQYSWRMVKEYCPDKLIALDLTRGVDIFRKILLERFPEYKRKILLVQASVFQMPFKDETFDYVFSLGVLMHTGSTHKAICHAARVLKYGGHINFWIYASEPVPYEAKEPGRDKKTAYVYFRILTTYGMVVLWRKLLLKLPNRIAVAIVRFFSSQFWYKANTLPIIRFFASTFFHCVKHPDFQYRFINQYDGWNNPWQDTWNEHEIFFTLQKCDIVIRGMSTWRLGIWGIKTNHFYR